MNQNHENSIESILEIIDFLKFDIQSNIFIDCGNGYLVTDKVEWNVKGNKIFRKKNNKVWDFPNVTISHFSIKLFEKSNAVLYRIQFGNFLYRGYIFIENKNILGKIK